MGGISLPVSVKNFDGNNPCIRRNACITSFGIVTVAAGDTRDMGDGCVLYGRMLLDTFLLFYCICRIFVVQ